MNHHEFDHDTFLDGLTLGYDDGEIRGDWSELQKIILIPKLGSFIEVFTEEDLAEIINLDDYR